MISANHARKLSEAAKKYEPLSSDIETVSKIIEERAKSGQTEAMVLFDEISFVEKTVLYLRGKGYKAEAFNHHHISISW